MSVFLFLDQPDLVPPEPRARPRVVATWKAGQSKKLFKYLKEFGTKWKLFCRMKPRLRRVVCGLAFCQTSLVITINLQAVENHTDIHILKRIPFSEYLFLVPKKIAHGWSKSKKRTEEAEAKAPPTDVSKASQKQPQLVSDDHTHSGINMIDKENDFDKNSSGASFFLYL